MNSKDSLDNARTLSRQHYSGFHPDADQQRVQRGASRRQAKIKTISD